ncbi:MAG TPA: hypothetical protein VMU29_00670 [Smithella sp.]|nr:hypothetical protein [Smithella sp.]
MNIGRNSIPVLLSFLIIMFMTITGCNDKPASSVISGTVSGDLKEGITINLTGAATASTTTDSSGNYSFTNQENGNYTVTPYLDGYTFNPTSTAVTISGASVTGVNFTSTHSGYGISGTITGAVAANVTVTVVNLLNASPTTTDSDGNYTLRSINLSNNTYIVQPSLTGYKFNPYTHAVPMDNASVTGIDFVSSVTYTGGSATGTYTWDASTGDLTITWTPGTTPCNWPRNNPHTGTDDEQFVTITTTTMTWPDPDTSIWPDGIPWLGVMRWTRTSSTANDPSGVWTAYDESGNKYTATFTATDATSGSITLTENIVACAYTRLQIISSNYYAWLSYQDPNHAATSVSVAGPGISTSTPLPLTYNASYGEWNTGSILLALYSPPFTYTFTVVISDPSNKWDEITCFVDLPTNLYTGWAALTKTLTFYWTGVANASGYVVQLRDGIDKHLIWESFTTTGTSIDYSGAAVLTSGDSYYFDVYVVGTSYCSNGISFTEQHFLAP